MKKRERQYIDWNKFWKKQWSKPKPTITYFADGYSKQIIEGGIIRVPDAMLKIMGRK